MELPNSPVKSCAAPPAAGAGDCDKQPSSTPVSDGWRHKGRSLATTPACPSSPSSQGTDLSPSPTNTQSPGWVRRRVVRRSRTHDCVAGMVLHAGSGRPRRFGSATPTRDSGRQLVSSVSFSGLGVSPSGKGGLLHENRSASSSRDIIDYRNLTPQVPFVPSIAKSIPKKRISLRKSRKAIKDLLGIRRHKREKVVSPGFLTPGRGDKGAVSVNTGKPTQEGTTNGYSGVPNHNDDLSDSSIELCSSICEDVASLQSFGSHTGCGEIFADEEHHLPIPHPVEGVQKQDPDKDICESKKTSPVVGSYQGGVEQMASPAHAEILDLFGLWDSFKSKEAKAVGNPDLNTFTLAQPISQQSTPDRTLLLTEQKIVDLLPDKGTPKSEKQEIVSTSDEGYYDYISPGLEDNSRGSVTPHLSNRFPRDSYSGDALYELFYDPCESRMSPIIDEDMSLSESILCQAGDHPQSMYSFHVGAEENLAPPLALDLVSQELLQSNWKGKECLLKLCDTEISLAMGIMNWLKQKANQMSPPGSVCGGVDTEASTFPPNCNKLHREGQDMPKNQLAVKDPALESPAVNESLVFLPNLRKDKPNIASPEGDIGTPTNGFCFRIFNKESPLTPNWDLKSPTLRSPGSVASTVFLLAINRESLCESCKRLLKKGSKELFLCASCVSFIEHIKTSDLLSPGSFHRMGSARSPCSLPPGFLESPISPCRTESDVSLMRLLEQCMTQVSTLRINGNQVDGGPEMVPPLSTLQESKQDTEEKDVRVEKSKEHSQKYLKSKQNPRKRSSNSENRGLASLPSCGAASQDAPSLLETGNLGLVTTNSSDELVLQKCRSSCPDKAGALFSASPTQTPGPTSLP
ncbi:APC membrane recruitment protein 3, partial [Brienomyrus brachyistius]|uniref:APC membrane recruitment protein 3 n=1 Tax=Brienomyrus brachyistius TaxID=42636 RepID=UPI0020B25CA0